jgi:multidrug efflux pump subunit AcrA (membrane-fusion protein)
MKFDRRLPNWSALAIILGLITGLLWLLCGCGQDQPAGAIQPTAKTLYTCGMHPQVIQDKPGNCPICGMKLTPISNQTTTAIDPVTIQNMGIRTATVTRGPLRRVIRTVGTIDFNETAIVDVTTKFKGWIEKLEVDATGEQVHRGDPLFEVYSPELYSAQREYLLALDQTAKAGGNDSLKTSALNKLKFYDISDEQIAAL